ncbi:MAG: hypothetical protein Q4G33_03930 [bacterium]|nr:hypothetical protein [bacterium]
MATFKYPYTVKANGKIVPPNTEVEIESTHCNADSDGMGVVIDKPIETPKKRTAKRKE